MKRFKKYGSIILALMIPAMVVWGSQQTILSTDQVKDALLTKCQANFTELYNYVTGTASPTLLTPTIASHVNAQHTHASAAQGGTLTNAVLGGTITGTYTLGGTPTITAPAISSPVFSGTATGTYTLGGTPTITIGSWNNFSLATGWGGAGSTQASYLKDPEGFVHLKGLGISDGGGNNTVYNALPANYRPEQEIYFLNNKRASTGEVHWIIISTGGVISANYFATSDKVFLDGIVFKAS